MSHAQLELHLSVDDAVRLESALAAFDRLIAGVPPAPEVLASAPLLTGWRRVLVPMSEPALVGQVEDHPLLSGSRRVVTSRLLVLNEAAGWGRCLNRLYRLESPAD
ncbi:hypothetical protein D8770_24960 [Methylobacterium sp. DB1607]|nr:hypothetical protein [Methylobacterium sp. DB1607]